MKKIKTFSLQSKPLSGKEFVKNCYRAQKRFEEQFGDLPPVRTTGGTYGLNQLEWNMVDKDIIAELAEDYTVTLGELWAFLKTKADNTLHHIAYVRNARGKVWAVGCLWRAERGWHVGARAITRPYDWFAGDRVFSRESGEVLK